METRASEHKINLIMNVALNRVALITYSNDDSMSPSRFNQREDVFVQNLLALPVTKLSRFIDEKWDYNDDVANPARNVKGAKLRIDFGKYKQIPAFVLIEIKCLLFYINLAPKAFAKKGLKNKKNQLAQKPNTFISRFEAGLRFFDHLFSKLKQDGAEFVEHRFNTITDILQADFESAAADFPYAVDATLKQFFFYLKHAAAKDILAAEVQVDFEKLEWPVQQTKKRKERLVFNNEDYEKLVMHASTRVAEFLQLMGEEVEDQLVIKHLASCAPHEPLSLSLGLLNDYGVIRLLSKEHNEADIEKCFTIDPAFYWPDGRLMYHERVRYIVKAKYNVRHLDSIRLQVNEVYYAAAFLVGIFTGMRPNALSEIRLTDDCLVTEDGVDLLISEDKKGRDLTRNLFDDKWVAIPIVKDALKAAQLLSPIKVNDYLFSNMDTVQSGSPMSNMGSTGIIRFLTSYASIVLGVERTKAIKINVYMMRHTLAYQLHRADLGLPFISFQLKHIVDSVEKYTSRGASSTTTLGYGEIAQRLTTDSKGKTIRHMAEVERVKSVMDPDGIYLGPKGKEHKARLKKAFEGYMAAGYTKEQVFEEMAEQGLAVINVGTGFCYGGTENFDESLPCIGTLRCNPIRCTNAVVTKANVPKWREVYFSNKALLGKDGYQDRQSQIVAVMKEAKAVLEQLGEEILV
jgi:hypothetical protein